MTFVIALDDPAAERTDLGGGKGAGLARLIRHGFAVPAGVVVTTDAYRHLLHDLPHFAERVLALPEEPGALAVAAAALRAELAACPLPPGLEAALAGLLQDGATYAVRSSATLEDLGAASFAGQHDTVLGCAGLPAVLDAVRRCFASFWQDRAIAYRRRHGLGADGAAMAVVIQRMVDARAAGVAFTLDPVSGRQDEIHISAHPGLGECVVDGEAEVDRFVFAKAGLAPRLATGPRPTLCLTGPEAAAVAGMALAVDAAFGAPQDIEWALDAAGIQVLQARPVTVIPPRWTRDESAERFPNPVTPLAWDFADTGFHAALAASFARMGLPPMREKWFACFGGWVYGNQNAVDLYLGRPLVPGGSLPALRAALPGLVARFGWVDQLPGEWALTLDRFLVEVGRLEAFDPDGADAAAIWAHVQDINRVGRAYFRHNIAISIGHGAMHKALSTVLGQMLPPAEAAAAYDVLVAPVQTRTGALNALLDGLAALGQADAALGRVLREGDARTILASGALAEFPAFRDAFAALLRDHGHRELDIDPYHPGWGNAPWTALQAVVARLDAARPPAPGLTQQRVAAASLLRQLSAGMPDDLALLLGELVRLARLYTEMDDNEHYQTSRLGPLLRRAVAALGRPLAGAGVIEDAMDLFFAHEAALAAAVAADGPEGWSVLAADIAAAKQAWRAQQDAAPDWSLDAPSEPVDDAEGLRGIPGSPGRAVGPAYVVRSPEDFAGCPEGAILVVRATTPAWTALFARAAGIVAESGGPLSHGAIAAREQGIPAVMAVRGAMAMLASGQRITVDGGRGTVIAEARP